MGRKPNDEKIEVVNIRMVKEPSIYSTEKIKTPEDVMRVLAKEFASYVDLEIFRMQALLRYEALAPGVRNDQVKEMQSRLLEELQEYRENSSVQLAPEIDEMISRVEVLHEMTTGETR